MIPIHELKLSADPRQPSPQGWIFSNQVEHLPETLLDPQRTALVFVPQARRFGVYSKTSLIAVRLFSEKLSQEIGRLRTAAGLAPEVLVDSLAHALSELAAFKRRLFPFASHEAFRLSHGDADGIPGVVVDDYGEVMVVQSGSSNGDFLVEFIARALAKSFSKPVFERSSGQVRSIENLPERTRWIVAPPNSPTSITATLASLRMGFSLLKAQKTGLFLDQRENLRTLSTLLAARSQGGAPLTSMLDICSYAGAWSSAGAKAGLQSFSLIDVDRTALENAEHNVRANAEGREITVQLHHADLFEELARLKDSGRKFDLVVADPPAFAKSKKHVNEAGRAYGRLARLASRLVADGGMLVTCSCSRHMEEPMFLDIVSRSLVGGDWILLAKGMQSPDHTILAQSGDADYLKCLFFCRRSF